MGAGKSTLGNKLARALAYDFYDSDHEIEKATGVDIGWIFDAEGEAGFRDRESQQLQLLLQKHDCVIATGGGVVLREQNRDLLRARSTVIYVEVDIEVQLARLRSCSNRPLLGASSSDPAADSAKRRAILTKLRDEREQLYLSTAHIRFPSGNKTPAADLAELIELIQNH